MKVQKDFFEEVELDLTGTCNLSCPLCSRNYTHAQHMVYKNIRPLDEIIKQLDEYPNLKRTFLAGQVSEPTLYPYFLEYLRYLKSRNIHIELFTNGSTRDEKFWKEVAEILGETDICVFTICGSTEELHQKYRIGSSLEKILKNAEAFRSVGNKNDHCQFIKFKYNAHDEDNTKNLGFSNWFGIGTEGIRNQNEKEVPLEDGVEPEETRDKLIREMFKRKPSPGDDVEINCKSYQDKKLYIDQKGKVSACYVHYEYEPEHTFEGEEYDYTSIFNFEFKDCWACEKKCRYLIEKLGVDFLC